MTATIDEENEMMSMDNSVSFVDVLFFGIKIIEFDTRRPQYLTNGAIRRLCSG
jgi:hypothetical protein